MIRTATLACISASLLPALVLAQIPGDNVAGAIWRYEMTKVAGKGVTRAGRFRIEGSNVYQPRGEKREPTVIGTIEGKEKGRAKAGSTVTINFESLAGSDGKELAAKGTISPMKGGVSGELVDSDGFHWKFTASRIRE